VNVPPEVPYDPGRRRGRVSSSVSESESVRFSPRAITRLLQTGHTRRLRVSHGSMHLVWYAANEVLFINPKHQD
jgi:hypothetical protein